MSVMFAGLTVANVVGVPLSTLLGQGTSWRVVYGLVGVVAAVAALLVWLAVPQLAASTDPAALRSELRAFRDRRIWLVLGVATLGGGGLFAVFSYIAPMLTHQAGYADSSVTWLLVLFGVGMTLGNLIGARLADIAAMRTLLGMLVLEIALALVFAASTHDKVVSAMMMVLLPASALGWTARAAGPHHRRRRRRRQPRGSLDPGRVQRRQLDRRLPGRSRDQCRVRLRLAERGGRRARPARPGGGGRTDPGRARGRAAGGHRPRSRPRRGLSGVGSTTSRPVVIDNVARREVI